MKNLATEINERLDEIIAIKNEMNRMLADLDNDSEITDTKTGKKVNLKKANKVVEDMLGRVYNELNKITNNGKNAKGIFNNQFYINDLLQDQSIARELRAK